VEEIRAYNGADSLAYITMDNLIEAVGQPKQVFCRACFDGEYPIHIPQDIKLTKLMLEDINGNGKANGSGANGHGVNGHGVNGVPVNGNGIVNGQVANAVALDGSAGHVEELLLGDSGDPGPESEASSVWKTTEPRTSECNRKKWFRLPVSGCSLLRTESAKSQAHRGLALLFC
jgi:hypothetical protein